MIVGKIRWLGHACFEIELMNRILLVDPWLDGNPKAPIKSSDIEKADIICVTHDHSDHLGDAVEICKRTGATFVGIAELGGYAREQGLKEAIGMNIGGTIEVKGISISMVQAFHSCSRGAPTGFVIKGEGKAIYHAGDTGLFGDMRTIGKIHHPNIALIPIGDYYTMGPKDAAEAVKLVKPVTVIPMHYQTFPVLVPSADEFVKLVREKTPRVEVVELEPGETYQF